MRISERPDAVRVFRFACRDGRLWLLSNHAGAINEAFSDIFGRGTVEFSVHPPGDGVLRADYVMGEDAGGDPIRSLEDPRSIRLRDSALLYPDAASHLFQFLLGVFEDTGELFWLPVGSVDGRTIIYLPDDDGGVHLNSTVLSHAFYLSIEGGQNRTTGLAVEGVGGANRTLAEQAFFRAMTDLMPSQPNFAMAAAVIRQSALDLYGARSATYLAIDQALNAVGLPEVQ